MRVVCGRRLVFLFCRDFNPGSALFILFSSCLCGVYWSQRWGGGGGGGESRWEYTL